MRPADKKNFHLMKDEREEVTSATRNVRLSEETETLQEVAEDSSE